MRKAALPAWVFCLWDFRLWFLWLPLFVFSYLLLHFVVGGYINVPQTLDNWLGNYAVPSHKLKELISHHWGFIGAAFLTLLLYAPRKPLRNWLAPQPRPEFLYTPEEQTDILRYNARGLGLVERRNELDKLKKFAESQALFSWWWLQGRGGIGKSKLALSWIESLPPGKYDAGFFRKPDADWSWNQWQPRKDTFIVIDDAAEAANEIVTMLENLATRDNLRHKVRVLVVERQATEQLKRINERKKIVEHRYESKPLIPSKFEETDLAELAQKLDKAEKLSEEKAVQKIMAVSQGVPFFMVLALESEGTNWHGREELLAEKVERLRKQVKDSLGPGLERQCLELIALASFAGGLPWEELTGQEEGCRGKKKFYDGFFGKNTKQGIPPLEPDLLAEYLILMTFDGLTEDRYGAFLTRAWHINPSGVAVTLFKLHGDFPQHDLLAELDQRPDKLGLSGQELIKAVAWWMEVRISRLATVAEDGSAKELTDKYFSDLYAATSALLGAEGRVGQAFKVLREIAVADPGNEEIRLALARGATSAARGYSMMRREGDAEGVGRAFKVLQETAAADPDNEEVKFLLAEVAFHATLGYGEMKDAKELGQAFEVLQECAVADPDDKEMQLLLAKGAVSAVSDYGKMKDAEGLGQAFEVLRKVAAANPNNQEIRFKLAESAFHATLGYGEMKDAKELGQAFEVLQECAVADPDDKEMQLLLAEGALSATMGYGEMEDAEGLGQALEVLQEVAVGWMQFILAKGAFYATLGYGKMKDAEGLGRAFEVLQEVASDYPYNLDNQGIQLLLAKGTINAIEDYMLMKQRAACTRLYPLFLEAKAVLLEAENAFVPIIVEVESVFVEVESESLGAVFAWERDASRNEALANWERLSKELKAFIENSDNDQR